MDIMKIVVVDDEKFNLLIAKDLIEEAVSNCEVKLCSAPETVMEMLEKEAIDIILLDIVMPKINGIEILKQIRSKDEYKDIQILMFTANTDAESFKECFEHGADDYIRKPINFTEFIARVRAAVKTRGHFIALKQMVGQMTKQYNELQEVTSKLKATQFYLVQKEKLASLGEIAAGVAHEINNPMGFIGSNLETMQSYLNKIKTLILMYKKYIQLASSENNAAVMASELQNIEQFEKKAKINFVLEDIEAIINDSKDGVERVSKIVRSLRNFARVGTENEKGWNDFNLIIEEALLIIRNEAKYVVNIDKRLVDLPNVWCDKGQIGQVLINIFINAIQAIKKQDRSDMGNITIETSLDNNCGICGDELRHDCKCVVCKVTDDGPGIKEETIKRVFDPFFTTKDVGEGTGLGLSIAHDIIVTKHAGSLMVQSEYGKGATFIIKIPVIVEEAGDTHA